MARVQHLDDVGVLRGDDLARARELPRPVGQRDAQLQVALAGRQPVADHALHDERVDVAAREHDDGRPGCANLAGQDRRDADGARRLDDELRALEQHEHGPGDVVVVDRDDLVDRVFDDFEVELARLRHGNTVGDRGADGDFGDGSRGERHGVRRGVDGLHADDPNLAAELRGALLQHGGHARDEPAAADRHDDGGEVGHLLEHLEAQGALAGDDVGVIERRNVDGTGALGVLGRGAQRLGDRVAPQHDVGAVVAGRGELRQGDSDGHEDRGRNAQLAGREGDALGVIAGGRGHDSARLLVVAEGGDAVVGAANLVRAGALQVFALHEDGNPEHAAQVVRRLHRRHVGNGRHGDASAFDVGQARPGDSRLVGHGAPPRAVARCERTPTRASRSPVSLRAARRVPNRRACRGRHDQTASTTTGRPASRTPTD